MIKLIILFLFFYINCIFGETYSGEAFNLKNNKKVFVEYRNEKIEDDKHVSSYVEFRDLNDKQIAKKNISFVKNNYLPDFKFEDTRTGYMEGGEFKNGEYTLFYKKNKDDKLNKKSFLIKNDTVAFCDEGVDQFVKDNWQEISNGKKFTFDFYISFLLSNFNFEIQRSKITDKTITFKIEIANVFFRQFIKPTFLIYNIEKRKMIHYEGVSNVNDENEKSYFVKINYFF